MTFPLYATVIILMIFILILFIILLIHKGRHIKSNLYLAWYFITQIIALIFGLFSGNPVCFITSEFFIFIWGVSFYFFIHALLNPGFKLKLIHLLHLIPSISITAYLIISSYPLTPQWNFTLFNKVLNPMFNASIISYNIAAFFSYYKYRKRVRIDSQLKKIVQEKWLNVALFGFAISCGIIQLGKLLGIQGDIFFIGNTIFLVYFCILFYVAIVNQAYIKPEIFEKYKNSPLTEEDARRMLYMLEEFMHNEKPFTNPEVSLKGMASQLKISERYLSQIINEYKNQNFSDYINFHRVQYSMELLKNPKNKDITVFSILFDSGFSSKTTFNAAFKKFAGCTPIEFKKKIFLINSQI